MADRRGVRSSSRHNTPIPQPPPTATTMQAQAETPRTSFGRDRRRRSRNSDLHAPEQYEGIDWLAPKKKGITQQAPSNLSHPEQPIEEPQQPIETQSNADSGWQQQIEDATGDPSTLAPTQTIQGQFTGQDEHVAVVHNEELQVEDVATGDLSASAPPQSTDDFLRLMKETRKADKENHRRGYFAPQANAQRVEFGDGFEGSQATPGPPRKGKEPKRSIAKRRRPVEDEESDEDVFETDIRDARAAERRQKAPVAKRVRIDPTSSAPTSHQPQDTNVAPPVLASHRPRLSDADEAYVLNEQDESPSEGEAPEMTEEAPPTSTFDEVRLLARLNAKSLAVERSRRMPQVRKGWTAEAEQAFLEYMEQMPRQYSEILKHDAKEGHNLLQNRSQVNLKDKARNMAITMIKSGTGLKPGFEDVINRNGQKGRELLEEGYTW